MGLEPMIPAFERAKTVHASDRAATVIDNVDIASVNKPQKKIMVNVQNTVTSFSSEM
jgi:hypothetical protein